MNTRDENPRLRPHRHTKVQHGQCPVCLHYGDDCTGEPAKTLVLGKVIDRYPRMLGLLKAAEPHLVTLNAIDVRRAIQALLKEIEQ